MSEFLIFIFVLTRFNYFNPKTPIESNYFTVVEQKENYAIIESNKRKYLYYSDETRVGNHLLIEAKYKFLKEDNEFYKYLNKQGVYYEVEGEIISNDNNLPLNQEIIERLLKNKDEENKSILKLILFNQKDQYSQKFYQSFASFSLSFMLVISGFHINLLFTCLKKSKGLKYLITGLYLYLLNFSVASLKAFIYFILKSLNLKSKGIFNNSDLLSLIMIALLFYNPSYCFNLGFIYSFGFSFIIELINNLFLKKNIKINLLKRGIIFLFSIPLILLNSYQINTNSFLASLIFVYPISFLFIFSLLYLFLDKFYLVYKLYYYFLKLILDFFTKYSYTLVFGKPSLAMIVLLYGFLLLAIYCYQNHLLKKGMIYLSLFFFALLIQYNLPNLDSRELVYFFDVGQGDCTIMKIKNSKSVVLIDTGGNHYKDLAVKEIIPFLKKQGINEIEKIIISHDDFDHNGAKESLVTNFKVNEVIESSLIKEVTIGRKIFTNLNVSDNRDNDGSIVLVGEYGGVTYLFSGDISSEKEKDIIRENPNLKVDILKVSHHGSNTASSEEFLDKVKPRIALIGVGKNNIYRHPSSEVIQRLEKRGIIIYRSDMEGTISLYKSRFKELIIVEKY